MVCATASMVCTTASMVCATANVDSWCCAELDIVGNLPEHYLGSSALQLSTLQQSPAAQEQAGSGGNQTLQCAAQGCLQAPHPLQASPSSQQQGGCLDNRRPQQLQAEAVYSHCPGNGADASHGIGTGHNDGHQHPRAVGCSGIGAVEHATSRSASVPCSAEIVDAFQAAGAMARHLQNSSESSQADQPSHTGPPSRQCSACLTFGLLHCHMRVFLTQSFSACHSSASWHITDNAARSVVVQQLMFKHGEFA